MGSSNYREFNNLVVLVEKLYNDGLFKDCELFLFTDNLVVDCAYYKGSFIESFVFVSDQSEEDSNDRRCDHSLYSFFSEENDRVRY